MCRLLELLTLYQPSLSSVKWNRRLPCLSFLVFSLYPIHQPDLFQPSFFSQLLLRLFEELIVDHPIQRKVFVDDAGADIFVEHNLDSILSDRQVGRIAGAEEIVSAVDDIRFALKPGGITGLDRLLFVVLCELHTQDLRRDKSFRRLRIFLQHFSAGDEDALRDAQRFVQINDHRKTFVEQSDRVFGGKRRGGDQTFLEGYGAQRGWADGAKCSVFVRIKIIALQVNSNRKVGKRSRASDADSFAAQIFNILRIFAAEQRVIRVVR